MGIFQCVPGSVLTCVLTYVDSIINHTLAESVLTFWADGGKRVKPVDGAQERSVLFGSLPDYLFRGSSRFGSAGGRVVLKLVIIHINGFGAFLFKILVRKADDGGISICIGVGVCG